MMTCQTFTISPEWDIQITVHEYEPALDGNNKAIKRVSRSACFQVQQGALLKCEYFTHMFQGPWKEARYHETTLHDDRIEAMEVLFRSLHQTLNVMVSTSVPVATIWQLIIACNKYKVEFRDGALKDWFVSLFETKRLSTRCTTEYFLERALLYPCYEFDYAQGFQQVSQTLAYGSKGHISESNPTDLSVLHLPQRVIQQLNAARGRLRNILHNGLFEPVANMLRHARCGCKEKTFFEYFRELEYIKVWPLENTMKHHSINDILSNLKRFDASKVTAHLKNDASKDADGGDGLDTSICMCNQVDWNAIVSSTANTVRKYFDGLCFDCMSVTKALQEGRNPDHEYWLSNERKKWDSNCRIRHGEPSWYFSFMGRREKRGVIAY